MAGIFDVIARLQEQAAELAPEIGAAFQNDLDDLGRRWSQLIPGTASNEELTGRLAPTVDAVTGAIGDAVQAMPVNTLPPATQAGLRASAGGDDTEADPTAPDGEPLLVPSGEKVLQRQGRTPQERTAQLAAIVERAMQPRRADNNPDLLAGSLAAPLVTRVDANGQVVPLIATRPSPRPWGEPAPYRNVVSYSEDDVIEPSTWGSPEKVGRLQHRLVNAGFLSGDFKFGYYDETSEKAYRDLLTFSSKNGMSLLEGLVEAHKARKWAAENGVPWEQIGGTADSGTSAVKPKYQAPDKATVRQAIKAEFVNELGRDPGPGELERYAAQWMRDDRADFQGQVDAITPDAADIPDNVFDDAPMLSEAGAGDEASTVEAATRVDPAARFAEAFDRRFAEERDFKDRQDVNREQGNLLAGILGTVDQVA